MDQQNIDTATDLKDRVRQLERELLRLHQFQTESEETAEARCEQLVEENSRLNDYQSVLQQQIEKTEEALAESLLDPLTHLFSPSEMCRTLREALTAARSGKETIGAILLELETDYLRRCLGAQRVELAILQAGQRLQAIVTTTDKLGRWGDSQFLLLLRSPDPNRAQVTEQIGQLTQSLVQMLERPFDFGGVSLALTAYAGALVVDGEDADQALEALQRSLRQAQEGESLHFHVYGEELRVKAARRQALQNVVTEAMSQDELQIYYQPIISASELRAVGLETRLRWKQPEGMVEAGEFIDALEESGQLLSLDEWVLDKACAQVARVPEAMVHVNLTSGHLLVADLPRRLLQFAEKAGLQPRRLCIELSESALIHAPDRVLALARDLSRKGAALAIDGFGSRLSSLAGMPLRFLKLDSQLVAQLEEPEARRLCRATLSMAHQMGTQVIAKRVETAEQVKWLCEAGCDFLEGHFFSPAVPFSEVPALLRRTWAEPG